MSCKNPTFLFSFVNIERKRDETRNLVQLFLTSSLKLWEECIIKSIYGKYTTFNQGLLRFGEGYNLAKTKSAKD